MTRKMGGTRRLLRRRLTQTMGVGSVAAALLLGGSALAQEGPTDSDQAAPEQPASDEPERKSADEGEGEKPSGPDEVEEERGDAAEASPEGKPSQDVSKAQQVKTPETKATREKTTAPRTEQQVQGDGADSPMPEEGDLSEGLEDLSLVELLQFDLRVASTKTDTTVQASPAAVTVVSREEIERYGYRSVAEALRDVTGTYLVDDHITPNLGVRGVPGAAFEGSGAVKVMIDGVPVAFRTTGENWLGPGLVPMASVERIEIVKGPTSSLYGADAFLGVINVITKETGHKNWGEVSTSGLASYNGNPGYRVEGAGGLVSRPWRFSMGAQFDQEDRSGLGMPSTSPSPTLANTAGERSRGQVLRSGVTTFKLSHTPSRQTEFSVMGRYARQQAGAEFAPWMQFTKVEGEDGGTRLSLHQGSLTLRAGSELTRKVRLEVTTTGFFGGTLPGDQVDTGDTLAVVHRDLSYAGGEGTIESVLEPIETLRLVLGVEASADREHLGAPDYRSREDGSSEPSAGNSEDFETTLVNLAARGQATWEIVPQYLVPTGGVRIDHNSVYGDRASGRIAVVSEVYRGMFLKSSYGTAFKAATPLLLYGRPLTIGDVIGSSELGPQELRSWDFTGDFRRKSAFDLDVTVSAWELIDRAVFRPEQINLIARNAAGATGWTIEANGKTRFSEVVGATLGAEWVRVNQLSGEEGYRGELFGNDPSIYPQWITRGAVWFRPPPTPLELWTASRLVGSRNASDSNTLEAGERYVLPPYAVLDVGVRTVGLKWFGERLTEVSLRGQNILNSAGDDAGFFGIDYPAAPPRVQLEFRQEL